MNILLRLKGTITKKSKAYYFLAGMLTLAGMLYISTNIFFTNNTFAVVVENNDGKFPQDYKIISPKIPDNVSIFGEGVPLENFEVYERVDREILVNTYWHSATILAIKRANRWFPVIEPILKQNNIPDDFKYLAVVESNLENVISPAGATGFWQFIKSASKQYGLEVNDEVDERYDVEKSTVAACKYLNTAYKKFGNWTMSASSYNAGISGIDKWSGLQKSANYWNLVLGSETSRYVARIIAIKLIMENPSVYGYDLNKSDLYQPLKYREIELNTSVKDFADYAATLDVNYKTLKLYNPWLRDTSLKNKGGAAYKIKVPEVASINIIKE
ncbi:MAG TPA: lytic transglycosylase domain-containing protein [Ignavibacteriaceae bacterium]|nr:lytic transglycosylase domain-containing protein [Ignavibacteriaceae bacterium]HRP91935.1 lytic transglycosylase domain-containing protein [Ignavibacteriaceae bacterium]